MKDIGNYAFEGCSGLSSINIPDSVTSIGIYVFDQCPKITKLECPSSLKMVNIGLTSLEYVTISKSTGKIPSYEDSYTDTPWYRSKNTIKKISLEDGIIEIGNKAFWGLNSITEISIPDSVERICSGAFYNCDSVTELVIPCSVIIEDEASFGNMTSIKKLTLKAGSGNMHNYLMSDIEKLPWYISRKNITEVNIEEGVETIGAYGLFGITGITELTLPDGMYEIGTCAFGQCTGLEKLVVPESVKVIDSEAFEDDVSLVLYVYEDSYAHKFAVKNNIPYELIETEESTTTQVLPNTSASQSRLSNIDKVIGVKLKNKKKKKLIIYWRGLKAAKKYQVRFAKNKKFKGAKTKVVKKSPITIKNVKLKKTYWVKIRGFNEKSYGSWSVVKHIKIKQ